MRCGNDQPVVVEKQTVIGKCDVCPVFYVWSNIRWSVGRVWPAISALASKRLTHLIRLLPLGDVIEAFSSCRQTIYGVVDERCCLSCEEINILAVDLF